jgi:hypothetical protein
MDNKQKLTEIIKSLLQIKDDVATNKFPITGLCSTFFSIHNESLSKCMGLYGLSYEDWPHYSGYPKFPIPDPARKHHAEREHDAEAIYWNSPNRYIGEYGMLRLDLLAWLIKQLQTKVEQHG